MSNVRSLNAAIMKYPFVEHVGVRIEEHGDGRSRCTLLLQEHHSNSAGIVHGGALFTLADTAMGAALYTTLKPTQICATIETKINYFKPVVGGTVVCTSEVISRGRTVANVEASLHSGAVLMAKAYGSFSIFERKQE